MAANNLVCARRVCKYVGIGLLGDLSYHSDCILFLQAKKKRSNECRLNSLSFFSPALSDIKTQLQICLVNESKCEKRRGALITPVSHSLRLRPQKKS